MLAVIGCGNANRSDDAVGVVVARALQQRLRECPRANVRVYDAGTGGMDVMFQARGTRKLVIVDAARTGSEPGTVYAVPGSELESEREPSLNLHDFRWDHALYAGRKIFRADFPTDVTVYLVEAASLELGLELSPVVRQAADRLIDRLGELVDEYVAR